MIDNGEGAVYRSSHPDVLAAWADTQRRFDAWHSEVVVLRAAFPDHQVLQHEFDGRISVAALRGPSAPGQAWRYVKRQDYWVPDRRLKSGKAMADRIDGIRVTGMGKLPGMPDTAHGGRAANGYGTQLHHPGMFEHDGTVWVKWSCSHEAVVESGWSKTTLDLELWELAKLSGYYLAVEEMEAAGV